MKDEINVGELPNEYHGFKVGERVKCEAHSVKGVVVHPNEWLFFPSSYVDVTHFVFIRSDSGKVDGYPPSSVERSELKFKIGDRVKVIGKVHNGFAGRVHGVTGVVSEFNVEGITGKMHDYLVTLDSKADPEGCFDEHELELAPEPTAHQVSNELAAAIVKYREAKAAMELAGTASSDAYKAHELASEAAYKAADAFRKAERELTELAGK
jgi:hypothetical protein